LEIFINFLIRPQEGSYEYQIQNEPHCQGLSSFPHLSLREWGETLGASLKRVPPGLPKILGRTLG